MHERKSYQRYADLHDSTFYFVRAFVRVSLDSACAAHVANHYNGAIAALGGLAVAIFTFTLWRVTRRMGIAGEDQLAAFKASLESERESAAEERRLLAAQIEAAALSANAAMKAAEAADLNAKASINVESPILVVESIEIRPPTDKNDYVSWVRSMHPIIKIKNYGRTPALVKEIIVNIVVASSLPRVPKYQRLQKHPDHCVIVERESLTYQEFFLGRQIDITDEFIAQYGNVEDDFFVVGKIVYSDFLNWTYERGFVFTWFERSQRLGQINTVYKRYDYQRRIEGAPTDTFDP